MINSDNNLLIANDKLTETNAKFAAVNKELAAVNKEFAHVHEQIKQYHIKQNEFIHIISHELKNTNPKHYGIYRASTIEP